MMKFLSLILPFTLIICSAFADSSEKARRMIISLTGNAPTAAQLQQIKNLITTSGERAAAAEITTWRSFLWNAGGVTSSWTLKSGTTSEFNDVRATFTGILRDETNFKEFFFGNIMYAGDGCKLGPPGSNACSNGSAPNAVRYFSRNPVFRTIPGYIGNPNGTPENTANFASATLGEIKTKDEYLHFNDNGNRVIFPFRSLLSSANDHYTMIQEANGPLENPSFFKRFAQDESIYSNDSNAIAGVFSLRGMGTFLQAGTNRAMIAYSMEHFLCKPIQELHDINIADDRVRRDVDRSPGNQPSTYQTTCKGCHAGMDAMGGAFAYYNFDGTKIEYAVDSTDEEGRTSIIQRKMNQNHTVYADGYDTQDDSWINYWTSGQNSSLGWGYPTSGFGAWDFGLMIANTEEMPNCMAKQVYDYVCGSSDTNTDQNNISYISSYFKVNGFNLKDLFINSAVACSGE